MRGSFTGLQPYRRPKRFKFWRCHHFFELYASINQNIDQRDIGEICTLFIGSISGFWLVNFVTGRIFLGDSGAYFLGYIVAFTAIFSLNANPNLSAWALILCTIHPVIEIFHTVIRRFWFKKSLLLADKKHMHHLVKKLPGP